MKRFLFVLIVFVAGVYTGSHFTTNPPERYPAADGQQVVTGMIVTKATWMDEYMVVFCPTGSKTLLIVKPDQYYEPGESAQMILLPLPILEVHRLGVYAYEQVG